MILLRQAIIQFALDQILPVDSIEEEIDIVYVQKRMHRIMLLEQHIPVEQTLRISYFLQFGQDFLIMLQLHQIENIIIILIGFFINLIVIDDLLNNLIVKVSKICPMNSGKRLQPVVLEFQGRVPKFLLEIIFLLSSKTAKFPDDELLQFLFGHQFFSYIIIFLKNIHAQ